ncbi:histone H1-like [Acyrthosiphon pisum]|uniref:H15 domain-containing protein n=1 Tax=Acyrthosiphon pisum TaxID=7029 RepID=A0A8R2FE66_ACYPI|nr:histone H1-like [Acyrthosiphon pisum]|eukprot:XP_008190049.1 PREDICTED: histone H1-like [Acyrthosiphon pisum]
MASTATVPAASSVAPIAASTPKKTKTPTAKSAVAAPAHPSTAVMVIAAVKELNEKKGSSLPAIKKYMSTNYKVDSTKLAPFIRKFLKAAVVKGTLLQTNGTGAMGHFKLPVEVKKKPATVKKPSAAVVKRVVAAKKPTAKSSSSGTPKKRKVAAKKAPAAAEPAAKKPKAVTAAKPKKSLVKAKKVVAAPKPPKAKKVATAVKKTKTPKKK